MDNIRVSDEAYKRIFARKVEMEKENVEGGQEKGGIVTYAKALDNIFEEIPVK